MYSSEMVVSEKNIKKMKFYNRENEIAMLQGIQQNSRQNAQMTFVTGRRRIGKTKLLLEATRQEPTLYFFVARKAESLLCEEFMEEVQNKLNIPVYGEINDFATLFRMLMEHSKQTCFNLIIDEFQEFLYINPSVYSDIQHYWDVNKDKSHINLLLSGSVYSLMHKIFEDNKEPLFGRATNNIFLRPFQPSVLKEILADNHPSFTSEDLLALYTFTGGVPKYVELLVDNKALTFNKMVNYIIKENSMFISEGKNILVDEFGKDYAIYFSILSCIASGKTSRSVIENTLNREISGYLVRLERDFSLIKKHIPLFAKSEMKNVLYEIEDPFLRFWFRFIYKYEHFIQSGAISQLKTFVLRDYQTFSGKSLEQYFVSKFVEQQDFTKIGGYWDKKGENEIDLIALNELTHTAVVAEIKRNKANIDMDKLRFKTANIYKELSSYDVKYVPLSMEDM